MISVVVPCYNEEFEVILVDDGSDEATWQGIEAIHRRDPRWKAVRFSRNFGHQTAVSAGIALAGGQAVIVIDADLQDPPEQLHRFLDKWREGYEVVYGLRRKRKEGLVKRACYHGFYRILAGISQPPIPVDSGDFCLMDRKVVDLLKSMPERNRFVRGLRAWVGFRQIGLEYERQARGAGRPKYTFGKLRKLAVDGILSFSTWPLRLATRLGLIVSTVAFLGAVFTFVQRVFADWFDKIGLGPVPGFATIVIAILFLGGVQLICLGIIGEYIGRIYDEVKGRPSWIVRESLGLGGPSGPGGPGGPDLPPGPTGASQAVPPRDREGR
jgi:glycosyltransferase involved in cell wall biosynthesis